MDVINLPSKGGEKKSEVVGNKGSKHRYEGGDSRCQVEWTHVHQGANHITYEHKSN